MQTLENHTAEPQSDRRSEAIRLMVGCVMGLIALNAVQIGAAFAGLEPHPDAEVVPIIAATAAIGIIALPMVRAGDRLGSKLGLVFAGLSMIGMGPHKLLLENGATIAPVAIVGFLAELTFIISAVRHLREST
jgi:putative Mn2+ efflux pump MntP